VSDTSCLVASVDLSAPALGWKDFRRDLGEPSPHSLFARIVAIFAIVFNSTEIGPCRLAIIMTLEVLLSEIEVQNGHLYWKDS
jgi:hypothetical protein